MKRVLSFISLMAILSSFSLISLSVASAEDTAVEVSMEAVNYTFAPDTITAEPGQTVTITFDVVEGSHTFAIDEIELDESVTQDGTVTFTAPSEAGDYEFYCSVGNHREAGMVGTLTVSEAEEVTTTDEDTTDREPTFSDVSTSHVNYAAIEYLVSIGTLEGYEDGTFLPDNTVNRAELMKILVAGQGIDPDPETYYGCFPDVEDDWYAKYVCYASSHGWVDGYDNGYFEPGNTVNKVEAVKMVVNALGFSDWLPDSVDEDIYDDTDSSAWYAPYLYVAKYAGFLEVDSGDYDPAGDMNRGWVSEYVFRAKVVYTTAESFYDTELRDYFFENAGFEL
ncbi:MAG: S-layer homology domain-containing protein [Candidatus Peregrinibacteria bacterium]|nr:S-layer homology domain-containing protein [Candidatus Peregrinibacteria bacterium]